MGFVWGMEEAYNLPQWTSANNRTQTYGRKWIRGVRDKNLLFDLNKEAQEKTTGGK